jgi:RNAse (barnase) inhibitor barstar
MTPLESLPPNAVAPLAGRTASTLRREAQAAGHRFLHADCCDAHDKPGVMAALGRGLVLPGCFGANLDALYDCLTDLEPAPGAAAPGLVLVVEHLPGSPGFGAEQRDALLEVLRDVAAEFAGRGVAFRAFWSLSRGAGSAPP